MSKTEPNGDVSNVTSVVFPADETGFTSVLRKAGTDAVQNLYGSDEKLAVFISTLKVLGQHARAKHAAQKIDADAVVRHADAVRAAEVSRLAEDTAREVARLTRLVEATQADLAAMTAPAE